MNSEYWPNYVTIREFIKMDKPKQRKLNDFVRPNKMQRKDKDVSDMEASQIIMNLSENKNDDGMNLGFQC